MFLKRIAAASDAERQMLIRVFEETLRKTNQELDNLVGKKSQ